MNPLEMIYITSPYGWRIHPITKKNSHHDGVDLRARFAPTYACFDGTIRKVANIGAYGMQVFIDHNGGIMSHYAHLSAIFVTKGQRVKAGQQIGVTGNTGTMTTAPHLHFGIKLNGEWVNPMEILVKGVIKEAKEEKVIIDEVAYDSLMIDGTLWVKCRETHEATGNQVDWVQGAGTEIIPIPKIKLDLIKEIL